MLDHIGIHIHSYERSKEFYRLALAPLDYELVIEYGDWAGFGWAGKPDFWIRGGKSTAPNLHIAFRADDRETVDEFHKAALEAGGEDNGAPAVRGEYHDNYYAAFVLDPDGHNLEVVCHTPPDLENP